MLAARSRATTYPDRHGDSDWFVFLELFISHSQLQRIEVNNELILLPLLESQTHVSSRSGKQP